MPSVLQKIIYTGTFLSTPSLDELQVLASHAVGVDEDGVIRHIEHMSDQSDTGIQELAVSWGWGKWEEGKWSCVKGGAGGNSWWFPGFVDTHIHASQYPNCGIIGKTTLLDWLTTYTFPLESSFSSLSKARQVYTACVSRTLSHGTTTASYFATRHVAATNLLADICLEKGQRAFIGRVCMDSDMSPSYYRDESPQQALTDTIATITHIKTIDPTHTLLTPILTPRFAPSCTSPLLTALGSLSAQENLPIQTHISENTSEVSLVASLFPTHTSYAHVYDAHALLTPRTVLAHAIHLTPPERALISSRKSSISHCPISNTSLSSGLCRVRDLLDQGITVGLGTDTSGGYSASILAAAREASMVSRIVAHLTPEEPSAPDPTTTTTTTTVPQTPDPNPKPCKKLSVPESLYLATLGGASCLGLSHRIGNFAIGMDWDAQLIELGTAPDAEGSVAGEGIGDVGGQDRGNTRRVYVRGRLVHERR
ncbi:hypothetical protein N7G274_008551 [Stereocaulon virgatum]|uniref:Amidohydrolase-related domain-containing protein n=1 Tax=Stereocaulon virgatum TaxID=373712 RepID=A0ABR4A178_9LECA